MLLNKVSFFFNTTYHDVEKATISFVPAIACCYIVYVFYCDGRGDKKRVCKKKDNVRTKTSSKIL